MSRARLARAASALEARLAREAGRPAVWLLAFAALLAVQIDAYWWPSRDASLHFSVAGSMWKSGGPTQFGSPGLFYPPGYALLISPAFLVSAKPFLLLSVVHYAFGLAVLGGVFVWARRLEGDLALWSTGLVVLNVSFWNYMRPNLTETAFMASSLWAVLALERAARGRAPLAAVAGALLLALASSMRYPGILFGAGFGLAQLLRQRRGEISLFAAVASAVAALLPALVVIVWRLGGGSATDAGDGYLPAVLELFRVASGNLAEAFRLRLWEIGRLLVPGMFKAYAPAGTWLHPTLLVYLPVVIVVVRGWWLLVRRRPDALLLTLPLHLGLYMAWLGDQGTRYLLPMLPALALALLVGLRRFTSPWGHGVAALLVLAHASVALGYYLKELPEARELDGRWGELESVGRVLRSETSAEVALDLPRALRLMLSIELDRQLSEAVVRDSGEADWIVTAQGGETPAGLEEHSSHGSLRLLRRTGR